MKQCPNCKKTYSDDLFYCLDDGVALSGVTGEIDRDARTEVLDVNPQSSIPTAIINTQPTVAAKTRESKFPYMIIGGLAAVCLILAAGVIFLIFRTSGSEGQKPTNTAISSAPSPLNNQNGASTQNLATPLATRSPAVNTGSSPPATVVDPSGKWRGTWSTDSGTLLDFGLTLTNKAGLEYEGSILWTLRKTVRPDKADKVGLSATEFVRGVFDPSTRTLRLSGYGKDDPDEVLVMTDEYRLSLSPDGRSISGLARNGGKWNGHVKLTR